MPRASITRRRLLAGTLAGGAGTLIGGLAAPAVSRAATRPVITHGIQSGDVGPGSAVIWSRADRPAQMLVEIATTESFADARALPPVNALPVTNFAAKLLVEDLPADQTIFYRVRFADLAQLDGISAPQTGRFRSAPQSRRDVSFVWGGDVAGQGWGINPDDGGMQTFATMRRHDPDLFIHSGDTIYADAPILPEVKLPDGTIWRNVTVPEKLKVAETLDEFRAAHLYNLLDDNLRAFAAQVPIFVQWDDHEFVNNWSGSKQLPASYTERSVSLLAARALRAFHESYPLRESMTDPDRIFRKIAYGPHLDVFMLDERSYRGPNNANRQESYGPESHFLGPRQLDWLKRELRASRATWKVLASDMPIGIVVGDEAGSEAIAQGDGPPLGRELEIADLLGFMRSAGIRNTIWVTADVHYTAAHYYSPDRARFKDFTPFWEFVSGPLHAGSFGPGPMDDTFGPEVRFVKAPGPGRQNLPPSAGFQFFGLGRIDGSTGRLTVSLRDRADTDLWSITLDPA